MIQLTMEYFFGKLETEVLYVIIAAVAAGAAAALLAVLLP
jgi:hypothetical protein